MLLLISFMVARQDRFLDCAQMWEGMNENFHLSCFPFHFRFLGAKGPFFHCFINKVYLGDDVIKTSYYGDIVNSLIGKLF